MLLATLVWLRGLIVTTGGLVSLTTTRPPLAHTWPIGHAPEPLPPGFACWPDD